MSDQELITPQERDVYEMLLSAGRIQEAIDMRGISHRPYEISEAERQIHRTRALLIHLIGSKLEKESCGKARFPCESCVSTARIVATLVWDLIQNWILNDIQPTSQLTEEQLVESFKTLVMNVRIKEITDHMANHINTKPELTLQRPSKALNNGPR